MTNTPANASFNAIKRQALEDQRRALLEEYQAATAQLARTLSDVDRVRLERQLRDLEQQIEKVEAAPQEAPLAADTLQDLFSALRESCAKALRMLSKENSFVADFWILFTPPGAENFEQLLLRWISLEPNGPGQLAWDEYQQLYASYQEDELTLDFRRKATPIVQNWESYFRTRYLGKTPGVPISWCKTSKASDLTTSQRRHLEQEYSELQRKYGSLTTAISALDVDIGRTWEAFRRQPIEEIRAERAAERDQVASRMAQIEMVLADPKQLLI